MYADVGDGDGFQDACLAWLRTGPGTGVIMPASDDCVELVARHRPALEALGYTPYRGADAVTLAMLDKDETYRLARQLGIPTPGHVLVRSPEEVDAASDRLSYPCCVKPLQSHRYGRLLGSGKVLFARDRRELDRVVARASAAGVDMMVTEVIPGADDQIYGYVTYIDDDGEPLVHFVERKLRQDPIHFGNGCYRKGQWDDEIARLGLRLCQGSGLRGVAHVEFKRDARDGTPKLMECNNRFDLCLELVGGAGIDLPLLVYNRITGRPAPRVRPARTGIRVLHTQEDVRAMLAYRRAGELSVRRWLRSLMHRQRFALFSWSDPMPSLVANARWLGGALHRRSRSLLARPARSPCCAPGPSGVR
jgi:predicted ATP-grasp superfamily ATP-dependent carboligase